VFLMVIPKQKSGLASIATRFVSGRTRYPPYPCTSSLYNVPQNIMPFPAFRETPPLSSKSLAHFIALQGAANYKILLASGHCRPAGLFSALPSGAKHNVFTGSVPSHI
jgi:hypothetical protein